MKVRIANAYSDGHESERVALLAEPDVLTEDWWDDVALPETGDGHGMDSSLGYCYTVTILTASNPAFVGQSREWSGY